MNHYKPTEQWHIDKCQYALLVFGQPSRTRTTHAQYLWCHNDAIYLAKCYDFSIKRFPEIEENAIWKHFSSCPYLFVWYSVYQNCMLSRQFLPKAILSFVKKAPYLQCIISIGNTFFCNCIEDGGQREKTVVARVSLVLTFVHRDIFGML